MNQWNTDELLINVSPTNLFSVRNAKNVHYVKDSLNNCLR